MRLRPFVLIILPFLLISCTRISESRIELPATPILSGGLGWGIVRSSYVRLKAKPDPASSDIAALRDGSLVEILGREFDSSGSSLWCRVRSPEVKGEKPEAAIDGWLGESDIEVYATKEQADRALRSKAE